MTTETSKRTGRKRGNNEGTIRQRPDGLYEARVTLPGGKRKSIYGKTRKEVQERMTATLRDVQQGLPVPTQRLTLAAYLNGWLTDVVKLTTRPATHESYARLVRVHIVPALGRLTLEQVTPQRVQALLNDKLAAGLSPRHIQYIRAILRRALGQALKWGMVARNAAALVDPPRVVRHEAAVLTSEQARTLMTALAGDRLAALITLTLTLGLRRGEVLGLHWSDVNLDAGTLSVRGQYQRLAGVWTLVEPKSETSRRTLALPAFIVTALRSHRTRQLEERLIAGLLWQDYNLVFPTPTGAPQNGSSVTHQFQRRLLRAGLPVMPFHALRHSAATILLARGMSIGEIQKVLGHSQISLTANLYAHATPEIFQNAADKMEALFAAR